ncbi:amidohydrolase family protein [Nonomuraea gerenzanensis]|uniref:amidohydrolase family protein n=1 Tax=Nonomuraea gerenzanensis TaxID=93944 RepID=UPI001CD9C3DC|nr:amidohydrolase family protein [Nonomuraea gerenzanensis]UBU18501.1 amidohydrolase family protein [Nonomuraea gerenzanensis]
MSRAWRVDGRLLPDDEPCTFFVSGGRVTREPVSRAETLVNSGWIIPGLVDAHCHIGLRTGGGAVTTAEESRSLAVADRDAGVLAIRDTGSPNSFPELDGLPDLPRVIRSGRHLAPPGGYLPGVAVECSSAELPAAVATQAAQGHGWIKLVGDWIDDASGGLLVRWDAVSVKAAVQDGHALGVKIAAHTFSEAGAAMMVEAGVDSIEHGPGLSTQLLEEMARSDIALVPTMSAIATFRSIAAVAEARHPRYAAHLRDLSAGFGSLVRAAHEIGVAVYVGTDAGCDVRHGLIAQEMLALHRTAGLSATQVLGAASWRAREWLGLDVLEEGSPADFVVYDTDPREDLTAVRQPRRIVLNGVPLR